MNTNFTPRLADGTRAEMAIDAADQSKIRMRAPWRAEVTDQITGRRYRVRGAACGIPGCGCDAVIICELTN
jgi:hypothetical protein